MGEDNLYVRIQEGVWRAFAGIRTLRRAFQMAGAQTSIMSLWEVLEKETSQLMSGFYHHWLGGCGKREALRRAARGILTTTRKDRGTGHPYFWGAFVLAGNPD